VAFFCNPASGGTFSSTAIEIIKWVKKFPVAQAKVTHILRPGKASEKTPKGVIPPSLCEISQNASRKKKNKKELEESHAMQIGLREEHSKQGITGGLIRHIYRDRESIRERRKDGAN
jgi:hypothetical protein